MLGKKCGGIRSLFFACGTHTQTRRTHMSTIDQQQTPSWVTRRLEYLEANVQSVAPRVWSRILTEDQRQRVRSSTSLQGHHSMADVWADLRYISRSEAVIDLARKTNFLLPDEGNLMLQYLGVAYAAANDGARHDRPSLDEGGNLWLADKVIRKVKLCGKHPTRTEELLNAFQKQGWKPVIDNPFLDENPELIHKAVQRTNKGLKRIRFRALHGGKRVAWAFK